jgi:hypothetical protein
VPKTATPAPLDDRSLWRLLLARCHADREKASLYRGDGRCSHLSDPAI